MQLLTPDALVLVYMTDHALPATANDVARALNVSRFAAARSLAKLESEGFVTAEHAPGKAYWRVNIAAADAALTALAATINHVL